MANLRPLSIQLQKKAKDELNEVESRISEDLEHIKEWLKKQHHLKVRTDDQWLVTFLRGCKYSLEKAKAKLDLYYSVRGVAPEYYRNRYPFSPICSKLSKSCSFAVLSQTPPAPTRCLFRFEGTTIDDCTFIDAVKYWFMALEILLMEDDNAIISGIECITDYALFNLSFAMQATPPMIKKILLIFESAFPVRVKAAYGINAPVIVENVLSIAKVFMSQKLKDRMHIYSTEHNDEVYKRIPLSIMPKEYGGENESIYKLADDFNKKIESYGNWFLDDEKYCSDESLRPKNIKSPSHLLGLEGSFRKLNVD